MLNGNCKREVSGRTSCVCMFVNMCACVLCVYIRRYLCECEMCVIRFYYYKMPATVGLLREASKVRKCNTEIHLNELSTVICWDWQQYIAFNYLHYVLPSDSNTNDPVHHTMLTHSHAHSLTVYCLSVTFLLLYIVSGINTVVVKRSNYSTESLKGADLVLSAGGDGTFLLGASKITSTAIPLIGVNTDPERCGTPADRIEVCYNNIHPHFHLHVARS